MRNLFTLLLSILCCADLLVLLSNLCYSLTCLKQAELASHLITCSSLALDSTAKTVAESCGFSQMQQTKYFAPASVPYDTL
jgi:hypothetical protein